MRSDKSRAFAPTAADLRTLGRHLETLSTASSVVLERFHYNVGLPWAWAIVATANHASASSATTLSSRSIDT